MLDDGRVSPLDPMARYRLPVPSNNNIVENNRVWNNADGIVLEGGVGNIIQNNTLDGVHRYGIRLKDNVSNTQVLNNTIKGTSNYALFVYNGSHTNVIVQNMVSGGRAGISVENPLNEIIRDNTILDVAGSGIILNGDIKNIEIDSNKIVGRGLRVFRMLPKYADLAKSYETQNDIWGWKTPLPIAKLGRDGSLVVWFFVFVLPLFITIVFKTRNGLRSALYGVTRRFLRLPSS